AAIRVSEVHSGLPHTVQGRSREISEGGMGGILAGELSAGQTVLVEFPLPTSRQELTLRALVHRHSMSHYGFEFLQTSSVVLQDIRRADRKSTRLNSSHQIISYAVFCLKKKRKTNQQEHGKTTNIRIITQRNARSQKLTVEAD